MCNYDISECDKFMFENILENSYSVDLEEAITDLAFELAEKQETILDQYPDIYEDPFLDEFVPLLNFYMGFYLSQISDE